MEATPTTIPPYIRLDFAYATRTVLYVMAGIMAAAALAGLIGLEPGRQEESGQGEQVQTEPARFVSPHQEREERRAERRAARRARRR